ncbi:MAG TPA: molybdenum cofactor biosynthesis protein MoaE [Planctomycetota bacterium]|nr:molybdenum cofactor biosynthesis protein MoaE [Planctomycetota bacterium]
MRVRVRLFAGLRERAAASEVELELPHAADVSALKRALEARIPALGPLGHVRVAIDRTYARDDALLAPEQEIALIPPVSGGSGEDEALARGVFEVAEDALDPAAAQARVEHPAFGACVLFSGLARDHARGRSVEQLEYEAYAAMLEPEMARVFERCRAAFGETASAGVDQRLRMLVLHRVGVVQIGEPAVVVAVASPHRDAAFRACRFLIDELKASLPIWKRESYPGGESWIGDRP